MNIATIFEKFIFFLMPKAVVGGLEVSDSVIRFLGTRGKMPNFSMRLPPGLVSEGQIKDYKNAVAALSAVKKHIDPRGNRKVNAVLTIPSSVVYTQTFQLPYVAKDDLESAAEFNIKMLSPLGKETAYSDWQLIGENQDQLELLVAFAPAAIIDEYVKAVTEAGFKLISLEFPSLSIVRLIKESGAAVDVNLPYLILNLTSEGLDFMIMKNGNLYFDYFQPWKTAGDGSRQINWSEFQETVVREVRRILNFYNTRWGKIENLILITPSFHDRLTALITQQFSLKVQPLTLRAYGKVAQSWFTVLGAAWRGNISRSRDTAISLMSVRVKQEYFHEEVLLLINLWRNIAAAALVFAIAAFLAVNVVIGRVQNLVGEHLRDISGIALDIDEINKLKNEAEEFNRLVDLIGGVKADRVDWVTLFKKIIQTAGPRVTIDRISIPSVSQLIGVSGNALNEASVFEFERNLAAKREFSDVRLPIASIQRTVAGRWAFGVSFALVEVPFLE